MGGEGRGARVLSLQKEVKGYSHVEGIGGDIKDFEVVLTWDTDFFLAILKERGYAESFHPFNSRGHNNSVTKS